MGKNLRVISINFPFQSPEVVQERTLSTDRALFDFDVVVIRPPTFGGSPIQNLSVFQMLDATMNSKKGELQRLFAQGGVLVVLLDVPDTYRVSTGGYLSGSAYTVNNYEFLHYNFINCVRSGMGQQITYSDATEPFVTVLRKSTVTWTAYLASIPDHPFNDLKFFAGVGAGTGVAGKMPCGEGHVIVLPNLKQLDEQAFFEACTEYRYKRQGSIPPDWVNEVFLPGLSVIESEITELDAQISGLQGARKEKKSQFDERSAYRHCMRRARVTWNL